MFAFLSSANRKTTTGQMSRRWGPSAPRCVLEKLEARTLMSTYQVTNLLDDGAGSLRQAVKDANANPGTDVITFSPRLQGTITLTTGQLTIIDSVQIDGPGSFTSKPSFGIRISGNKTSRIFQVPYRRTQVAISGLFLTDGNPGASFGGAVDNYGYLTLSNDYLFGNVAASFGSTRSRLFGGGGAVMNQGTLNVSDCEFQDNEVFSEDAMSTDGGAAIYNNGSAFVTRSSFFGNNAEISQNAGSNSNFVANGGAIFNNAWLQLLNSTLEANVAGINLAPLANSGAGSGAALYSAGGAQSTVINCTINENHSASLGAVFGAKNAIVKIGNTIVSDNRVNGNPFVFYANVSGAFTSLGHNLISVGLPPQFLPSDFVGNALNPINPYLSDPGDFGGTPTEAIESPNSKAINHGSNALASAYFLTTDQRGQPRALAGTVDIGAYESKYVLAVP